MLRTCVLLLAMAASAVQAPSSGQFPAGWQVRIDGGTHDGKPMTAKDVSFVNMAPGWHITTGPAAILYRPSARATGNYTLTSENFLFDPGKRREAYGIIFGGRDLDAETQAYTYFLIRRSGEYLIKRRTGDTTSVVRDWTPHPAILKYDDRGTAQSAKNVLAVQVKGDTVTFQVNGQTVTTVPARELDTEGLVGLRVNHMVNLHVTSLDVAPDK